MMVKNKILNKILKTYFLVFAMFSILSVNLVLNNILVYYNISNKYTSYIVFLITVPSFICMLLTANQWNEDKEDK